MPDIPKPGAVLLAPMSFNQPLPSQLQPGAPLVHDIVGRALWQRDIHVNTPAPADFRNAWLTAAKGVGSLYGPDGQFEPARYDAVARSLVQVYRNRGEQFEVLLIPYLVYRDGAVVGQSVQWDGVARNLPLENPNRDVTHIESRRGLKAACISLKMVAYDADGNRLYETYGGLEVAVRMKLAEGYWSWTERGDLFRDRGDLEEGARVALKPLLRK